MTRAGALGKVSGSADFISLGRDVGADEDHERDERKHERCVLQRFPHQSEIDLDVLAFLPQA
jgi:hypothetical protein